MRLFGDAGRATDSCPDSKVMALIRTVVNQSVTKVLQRSTILSAVQRASHKRIAEPHMKDDSATRTIPLPAFTVPVDKIVKNKIGERSVEKAEVDQQCNISRCTNIGYNIKAEQIFGHKRPTPSHPLALNGYIQR